MTFLTSCAAEGGVRREGAWREGLQARATAPRESRQKGVPKTGFGRENRRARLPVGYGLRYEPATEAHQVNGIKL